VERLISKRTKAIIGVHLFGYPANVEALGKIARNFKCTLIYDAAQGFGAKVKNKGIGAYGDFTAFSFGRGKLFSVGDGGALICRTRRLYEKAVAFSQHPLRNHRDIDNKQLRDSIDGVSMNFRMHPLIASLAIGQLEGLFAQDIFARYKIRFKKICEKFTDKGLGSMLPRIPSGSEPSGVTIPLISGLKGLSKNQKGIIKNLNLELIENNSFRPLHLTATIKRERLLGGQGITAHFSHNKGQSPVTEKRCENNHYFLNCL
jgi:dTDP-4-amino-4,6-dideoxygalactose transaminase